MTTGHVSNYQLASNSVSFNEFQCQVNLSLKCASRLYVNVPHSLTTSPADLTHHSAADSIFGKISLQSNNRVCFYPQTTNNHSQNISEIIWLQHGPSGHIYAKFLSLRRLGLHKEKQAFSEVMESTRTHLQQDTARQKNEIIFCQPTLTLNYTYQPNTLPNLKPGLSRVLLVTFHLFIRNSPKSFYSP